MIKLKFANQISTGTLSWVGLDNPKPIELSLHLNATKEEVVLALAHELGHLRTITPVYTRGLNERSFDIILEVELLAWGWALSHLSPQEWNVSTIKRWLSSYIIKPEDKQILSMFIAKLREIKKLWKEEKQK